MDSPTSSAESPAPKEPGVKKETIEELRTQFDRLLQFGIHQVKPHRYELKWAQYIISPGKKIDLRWNRNLVLANYTALNSLMPDYYSLKIEEEIIDHEDNERDFYNSYTLSGNDRLVHSEPVISSWKAEREESSLDLMNMSYEELAELEEEQDKMKKLFAAVTEDEAQDLIKMLLPLKPEDNLLKAKKT